MGGTGQEIQLLTSWDHSQDIWPLWASVSPSVIRGFELITSQGLSRKVHGALTFDLRPPPSTGSPDPALKVASAPLNSRGHPLLGEPFPPCRPLAIQAETGHRPAAQQSGLSCPEQPPPEQPRWPPPQRNPLILYLSKCLWDWNMSLYFKYGYHWRGWKSWQGHTPGPWSRTSQPTELSEITCLSHAVFVFWQHKRTKPCVHVRKHLSLKEPIQES